MGKIESKGRDILRRQFYDRGSQSRNEIKLANVRKAIYNTISSKNSLRQHDSQWKQFAHYVEEKHSVKSLKKIDEKNIQVIVGTEVQFVADEMAKLKKQCILCDKLKKLLYQDLLEDLTCLTF